MYLSILLWCQVIIIWIFIVKIQVSLYIRQRRSPGKLSTWWDVIPWIIADSQDF